MFGSAMIANSPGTVVDISTEETRALFMSLYSTAPLNGPVYEPLSYYSPRWGIIKLTFDVGWAL